jgi:C4-dicarboxylate-specific signal transduction histidine kinase
MERQLVVSSRFSALGDMAGGIAHEINTPLSVVMMLIGQIEHYLGERSRTDEILKALRTMETAVFSISNIIKGLRTFAHEATNDPFQDVRVRDLISNTLVLCGEKFRVHNIDLHICDVASDLTCRCRPVEMRQVLFNLLINAFDAVSKLEDKWVRLDVTEDRDSLRFTITDSGKGIDPQIRESMMLPFFTTKPKGAGPGLGLAVSKSIVEDHQGTLLLDTNCVNTRFEVLIPKHLGKLSA